MIFFVCKCERLFFFGVFKQFCGFWLWLKNRYLCFLRVDYFVFQVNVGRQSSHMVELLVVRTLFTVPGLGKWVCTMGTISNLTGSSQLPTVSPGSLNLPIIVFDLVTGIAFMLMHMVPSKSAMSPKLSHIQTTTDQSWLIMTLLWSSLTGLWFWTVTWILSACLRWANRSLQTARAL